MSESILIVDDERGIRETLSAVLRDEGFIAESVDSGEACLKALAQRAFGCVLLDVWLPGINGLETLKQMRESNFDAAVVIISGHGNVETAVRATKLGCVRFHREAFVDREDGADRSQCFAAATARALQRRNVCRVE